MGDMYDVMFVRWAYPREDHPVRQNTALGFDIIPVSRYAVISVAEPLPRDTGLLSGCGLINARPSERVILLSTT